MPKSFLFTHKRYDYDDYSAATQVKVEVVENDMEEEEDSVIQDLSSGGSGQHLGAAHGRSSTSVSSASSGGYSEDESLSPLPLVGRNTLKSRLQAKLSSNVTRNNNVFANRHPLVVPKKRALVPNTETEIQIKEEVVHSEGTPTLNSSFKSLLVSPVTNASGIQQHDDFHRHRGNVIHYLHSQQKFQNPCLPSTQSGSSYQIKLISPPPGGTLAHSIGHRGGHSIVRGKNREDLVKMETMTPSPLQFIIAAAEQQEQAEEERVFMEGSRSEDSQQQSYHHSHHSQQVGPRSAFQIHALQEQPVNLSVKKVDLFNLTQLAEVSIAAAKREMMSSNVRSSSTSTNNSTTISDCPSSTLNGVSLMNAQSPLSSTNHGPAKPASLSIQFPVNANNSVAKGNTESMHVDTVVVIPTKNVDPNSSRNGISEHKKLIKTDTTKAQVGSSKESSGKIMGKLKKANSSSLLIVASEKEKLQNDKNLGDVPSSSNCTITSNNSCTSVSSSTSSSSSAAGASQRHRCVECGKGFSTLSNLARHRQTHRSLSDASAVKKCPHCDKVYVSMPAFSMHLRTHNQGCKCPYCGKGFSRPWLLQGHIRTHTGEKPFKCGICSKAFADKSNLRAHTQTHSTEKPFACQRCGKLFALKSYLCKHIESSCMKSNRPSGCTANGGSGTGNGGSSVTTTISSTKKQQHHHHQHGAINNSSSASSPVSPCSTRGTSPSLTTMIMSTLSSSSPTNRDIRSAIANATTTVTACSNNITTTSSLSSLGNNTMVSAVATPHSRKNGVAATSLSKTTHTSVLGFSSHNNNNNNEEINRPSLKANDNNNEHSSSSRNKNNCIMSAATTTSTFSSGSVRSKGDNKSVVGKSSKIRKVGDSAA